MSVGWAPIFAEETSGVSLPARCPAVVEITARLPSAPKRMGFCGVITVGPWRCAFWRVLAIEARPGEVWYDSDGDFRSRSELGQWVRKLSDGFA